jgi:hypothetical protein
MILSREVKVNKISNLPFPSVLFLLSTESIAMNSAILIILSHLISSHLISLEISEKRRVGKKKNRTTYLTV